MQKNRIFFWLLVSSLNSSCQAGRGDTSADKIERDTQYVDDDGDGFTEFEGDCDDGDNSIYPDAEVPD